MGEFVAHIFEPFERERNSTISGIQGTGLGMAITKSPLRPQADLLEHVGDAVAGVEVVVHHQGPAVHQLGDRLGLQVLLNLLSNCVKYTGAGGVVSMRIVEKSGAPAGYVMARAVKPTMAFMGVRMSWDMLERKTLLALLARLACSQLPHRPGRRSPVLPDEGRAGGEVG